jgi:hypothetical protein
MRISLGENNSLGYGHVLTCCGKRQPVNIRELEEDGEVWECSYCDKPLMVRIDGEWYEIGHEITI